MSFKKRMNSHTRRHIKDFMSARKEASTIQIYDYIFDKCRASSGRTYCPTYNELAGRLRGISWMKNLNPKIKGVYVNNKKAHWIYIKEEVEREL